MKDKRRIKIEPCSIGDLTDRRAFYLEFAPLPEHARFVERLYVMKDCGIMTADRRSFASPLTEIAFLFIEVPNTSAYAPRIVVNVPSFGHRKKKQPFHGWIFGIKCHLSERQTSAADRPCLMQCRGRLQTLPFSPTPIVTTVEVLNQLCGDLTNELIAQTALVQSRGERTVTELASRQMMSTRTLHRRFTEATGLSPKRHLTLERFRRAVRDVPAPGTRLSELSDALGFADQAHMTREFQRHAGLSPGTFQQA
ncbi:MAG: helix-turn-helix domain-containing protein [Hyphomicrobiaceae bacterium]